MLIDPSCIPDVIEKVKSDEFYIQVNRDIFDTIFAMFSYGQSVDAVTVLEQMKVRGVYKDTTQQYLMEVMQITPHGGERAQVRGHRARSGTAAQPAHRGR